ncbi:Predicted DNA-binding protein, UPF0251 family [Caminicella sporogenes DSM 14501]|uniref:UPF0251 protein SAMN02745883_01201 n=1 Tax=Caminicella sporogenes DSM 14501 TaxID=1121266 RepID=A0A1M6PGR3_9FIRM|nr:DUF134 domain-containing protein [Caminicella sporogenes]RKD21405.1 hypothetical protein BET04_08165 [Caminicella sporogenes]WIF95456.1 DUF134 domain-containing protein [Caminicella sporogenes]SHK07148.1 Predicted DNA-binding protein, UPF0251 family [Caminicella sporogenes DSM 14501]
MPRPRKRRRVCGLPDFTMFGPVKEMVNSEDIITMTVEEYEVIRLMDLEGLDQERCAERMEVARSTVQRMYSDAKKKIADSLVNGKVLKIEGGDYILCCDDVKKGKCTPCFRRRHRHRGNNAF